MPRIGESDACYSGYHEDCAHCVCYCHPLPKERHQVKAMKLLDVGSDETTVERYILDPTWVMQQKHDGARMVMHAHEGRIDFLAQTGEPMKFAAAAIVLPALKEYLGPRLDDLGIVELMLDGEIMPETGIYHVWDVPLATTLYETLVDGSEGWTWRDRTLRGALADLEGSLISFAVTARIEETKRLLWARVVAEGVEGAISKHVDSTWNDDGSRTDQWVKHKLVKTADVIVTAVQRTFKPDGVTLSHGKAELAVRVSHDPLPYVNAKGKRLSIEEWGELPEAGRTGRGSYGYVGRTLFPVGNASLIGKDLTIDVGSVVEVAYLNWQSAMIQPRIIRQRFDKPVEDCGLDQFPPYYRTVVKL